jgi:predicted phosphoribosyltransferase
MTADSILDKVELPLSRIVTVPTNAPKFADLASAGRRLASRLDNWLGKDQTVVVAIARGGVPVGLEVANYLGTPLDLLLIRRMLAPRGPDSEICAVNICGTLVMDPELQLPPAATKTPLEYFIADALKELDLRERTCRGARPPFDVAHKNVILVDNGVHTGSTVLTAIRALGKMKPSRVVVAVPVAAPASRARMEAAADDVACLAWPKPFGHVGLWYANFDVPDEEQIRHMLDQAAAR